MKLNGLSDPDIVNKTILLDNELYGETGRQPTHTAMGTDLASVARSCGFPDTHIVRTATELSTLRDGIHALQGPLFAVVKVSQDDVPRALPPRDGAFLSHRMRAALLGAEHALNT